MRICMAITIVLLKTGHSNSDNRIDRIGKKYQWIAFHEIMGILADNYKYMDDDANEGAGGYELFHGTWQSFLRNINPSMIARVNNVDSDVQDDSKEAEEQEWYKEEEFDNWKYSGTNRSWASWLEICQILFS